MVRWPASQGRREVVAPAIEGRARWTLAATRTWTWTWTSTLTRTSRTSMSRSLGRAVAHAAAGDRVVPHRRRHTEGPHDYAPVRG